mmetsp:Transcript_14421/g.35187  ORF Transcript_14421/g.35187 Transcript_14421/m.35187 type:complete len:315 (+) Transcript_14421:4300-5244(+)
MTQGHIDMTRGREFVGIVHDGIVHVLQKAGAPRQVHHLLLFCLFVHVFANLRKSGVDIRREMFREIVRSAQHLHPNHLSVPTIPQPRHNSRCHLEERLAHEGVPQQLMGFARDHQGSWRRCVQDWCHLRDGVPHRELQPMAVDTPHYHQRQRSVPDDGVQSQRAPLGQTLARVLVQRSAHLEAHRRGESGGVGGGARRRPHLVHLPHRHHRVTRELDDVRAVPGEHVNHVAEVLVERVSHALRPGEAGGAGPHEVRPRLAPRTSRAAIAHLSQGGVPGNVGEYDHRLHHVLGRDDGAGLGRVFQRDERDEPGGA